MHAEQPRSAVMEASAGSQDVTPMETCIPPVPARGWPEQWREEESRCAALANACVQSSREAPRWRHRQEVTSMATCKRVANRPAVVSERARHTTSILWRKAQKSMSGAASAWEPLERLGAAHARIKDPKSVATYEGDTTQAKGVSERTRPASLRDLHEARALAEAPEAAGRGRRAARNGRSGAIARLWREKYPTRVRGPRAHRRRRRASKGGGRRGKVRRRPRCGGVASLAEIFTATVIIVLMEIRAPARPPPGAVSRSGGTSHRENPRWNDRG